MIQVERKKTIFVWEYLDFYRYVKIQSWTVSEQIRIRFIAMLIFTYEEFALVAYILVVNSTHEHKYRKSKEIKCTKIQINTINTKNTG